MPQRQENLYRKHFLFDVGAVQYHVCFFTLRDFRVFCIFVRTREIQNSFVETFPIDRHDSAFILERLEVSNILIII